MGDCEITNTPTYTERFEEVCPYYMAMGMTYEQFWYGDPCIAKAYREADKIQRRRMNEELWLGGIYMAEAIASTVGNMFTKGEKHRYPIEPKPITEDEIRERQEREQRQREEKIKARFMARALSLNAREVNKNES